MHQLIRSTVGIFTYYQQPWLEPNVGSSSTASHCGKEWSSSRLLPHPQPSRTSTAVLIAGAGDASSAPSPCTSASSPPSTGLPFGCEGRSRRQHSACVSASTRAIESINCWLVMLSVHARRGACVALWWGEHMLSDPRTSCTTCDSRRARVLDAFTTPLALCVGLVPACGSEAAGSACGPCERADIQVHGNVLP
jgi:hypothetical protein